MQNSNRISHKNISFTLILFTCFSLRCATTTQLLFFICFLHFLNVFHIKWVFSLFYASHSSLIPSTLKNLLLCVCLLVCSVCFYNGILAFSLRSLLYDTALFIIRVCYLICFALSATKTFFFCVFLVL